MQTTLETLLSLVADEAQSDATRDQEVFAQD